MASNDSDAWYSRNESDDKGSFDGKLSDNNGKSSSSKCQQRLVDSTYDRGSDLEVDSGDFEEESGLCDSDSDSSPPTPPNAPHLSG